MYEDYGDRAAMYVVYIEEAHASDVWQLPVNERQNVVFATPKSMDERYAIGQSCVRKLNIKMPALVDAMDDGVEREYTGWPDRLYVIDAAGRVAYKSKPGPFGFKPLEARGVLHRLVGGSGGVEE
jgi:type I thyroxine 5'-deiodinase